LLRELTAAKPGITLVNPGALRGREHLLYIP
jgi:hypothetical protein